MKVSESPTMKILVPNWRAYLALWLVNSLSFISTTKVTLIHFQAWKKLLLISLNVVCTVSLVEILASSWNLKELDKKGRPRCVFPLKLISDFFHKTFHIRNFNTDSFQRSRWFCNYTKSMVTYVVKFSKKGKHKI